MAPRFGANTNDTEYGDPLLTDGRFSSVEARLIGSASLEEAAKLFFEVADLPMPLVIQDDWFCPAYGCMVWFSPAISLRGERLCVTHISQLGRSILSHAYYLHKPTGKCTWCVLVIFIAFKIVILLCL